MSLIVGIPFLAYRETRETRENYRKLGKLWETGLLGFWGRLRATVPFRTATEEFEIFEEILENMYRKIQGFHEKS